jgi:hypothetical protein
MPHSPPFHRVLPAFGLLALAACGDDDDPVGLNPCATRTTQAIGATTSGELETGDCSAADRFVDRYIFTVPAGGASLRINYQSAAIDPHLFLFDTQGRLLVQNDDSADTDTFNSSLWVLLGAGTYHLDATSFDEDETGTYSLSVANTASAVNGCPVVEFDDPGELAYVTIGTTTNQNVQASDCSTTAPEGTYYSDRFRLFLPAGRGATIRMTSTAVDPFLSVVDVTNACPCDVVDDDDSGGGTAARITIAATNAPRQLVIDASTSVVTETGAYTLTVEQ